MKSTPLKNIKITNEHVLFLCIFLIAVLLRFPQLGKASLNDYEAKIALSSINVFKRVNAILPAQPLLLSLTSLFYIFASNNFSARIASAISGCLFAISPIFFKKWIGGRESLIIGLFLAFDPALISISRQVDSRMLLLLLFVLFIAAILNSKRIITGIIGGLLLLCGPSFWQIALILCLTFFLFYMLAWDKKMNKQRIKELFKEFYNKIPQFLLGFLISLFLIGTRFFSRPDLLNLIPQSFIEVSNSWLVRNQIFNQSFFLTIFFFSSYPLVCLLCLSGIIQEILRKDTLSFLLLIYLLCAFLLFLINPAAKTADIFIFIVPMYYFVSKIMVVWVDLVNKHLKESLLIGIPIICLLGFVWLAIIRILNLPIGSIDAAKMFILLIGTMLLLGIIIVLIGWGWSIKSAISGLSLAVFFILALFHLSVSIHATGITSRPESELWWLDHYFKSPELISTTVEDISLWNTGIKNAINVSIVGFDSPSLEWVLKEQGIVKYGEIPISAPPSMMILKEANSSVLRNEYRGQKFALHSFPFWTMNLEQSVTSIDFYRWLFLRDGFINNEDAELWARADLFVGNNLKFENNN
jgi:hypothetical protein